MTGSAPHPARPRRKTVLRLLRIAITLALVAVLVAVVDLREAASLVAAAHPGLLAAALLLALVDRAVMIGKWYPLLRVQSTAVPLASAARAYLSAGFAATFLPSSVGGDVVRTLLLTRHGPSAVQIGASIVTERVLGLLGLAASSVLAAALGASLVPGFVPLLLPLSAILVGAIVLAALLLTAGGQRLLERLTVLAYFPRLRTLALGMVAAIGAYRARRRTLALVGGLSLLEQLLPVLVFWAVALAVDARVTLPMLLAAVPPAYLLARMPISFAGLGILEGALILLLGFFGVAPAVTLALALLSRVAHLGAVVPGAFGWSEIVTARRAPDTSRAGATIDAPALERGRPLGTDGALPHHP